MHDNMKQCRKNLEINDTKWYPLGGVKKICTTTDRKYQRRGHEYQPLNHTARVLGYTKVGRHTGLRAFTGRVRGIGITFEIEPKSSSLFLTTHKEEVQGLGP